MSFEVLANNGDYRGTSHPYKINFLFTPCMKVCEKIPNLSLFNFSPFPDIEAQAVGDVFIDILGEIIGMSDIIEKNLSGKLSKLLEIQLKDLRLVINSVNFISVLTGTVVIGILRTSHTRRAKSPYYFCLSFQ